MVCNITSTGRDITFFWFIVPYFFILKEIMELIFQAILLELSKYLDNKDVQKMQAKEKNK